MALGYRATPVSVGGTGTVPKQTGTVAGDLVILFARDITGGGYTIACSGFTSRSTASASGADCVALLTRTCDGTESANFTVTTTGTAANLYTIIVTLSGNAVYDASITLASTSSSASSIPVPGITVTNAGSWAIWMAQANVAITKPTGYTERYNAGASSAEVSDNQSVAAGATGTVTGTVSSATYPTGALVSVYPPVVPGAAALAASSTVTGAAATAGGAVLSAASALTASAVIFVPGTAVLAAVSALTAEEGIAHGTAVLPAAATLTAVPRMIVRAPAVLPAAATLTAVPRMIVRAPAVLPGSAALSAAGVVIPPGLLSTAAFRKPIQIPGGAVVGDVLTSDASGNATWQPPATPGGFTVGGVLTANGGTTTAGSTPVLTPTFANGTAAQLSDTSRDYWCYLQTSASGTFSVVIGPTSTPTSTIFASVTLASAQLVSFRVPASWWVRWSGTATLTTQTAVGC